MQYWKRFSYFGLGRDFPGALDAVRGPVGAGRHAAALEFALLGRHRSVLGEQRVVNLEWQLFPALGFQADAPSLHGALTGQPAFFAELVRYQYKRDTGEGAEEDDGLPADPEQRREFASRAYSVVRSWRRCPAAGTDNRPDAAALRVWTDQAREALAKDDRLGPGDNEIGQALRGPRRTTTACLRRGRSATCSRTSAATASTVAWGLACSTGAASRAAASTTAASRRATSPPCTAEPPTRQRRGRGPPGCCGASPTATNTTPGAWRRGRGTPARDRHLSPRRASRMRQ